MALASASRFTGDVTAPAATLKFTTQRPQFALEKANNTALFRAVAEAWVHERVVHQGEGHDADMQEYFDAVLAPAIQERETALVNVMHECFQTELGAKQALLHTQSQHVEMLVQQQTTHENELAHWQSKLDRRIAENNQLRKDFYKQLLMLRDMVNKQKNDPKTLKVLDDAIVTISMGKDKASGFTAMSAGASGTIAAAAASHSSIKHEGRPGNSSSAENGGPTSMRREKDKWEERAREAMYEFCYVLSGEIRVLICICVPVGWNASSYRSRCYG
jgi:hypothetical protein